MSPRKKLPAHTRGSGNIFADLGLPNAEEHQLKAALVVQLKRLMIDAPSLVVACGLAMRRFDPQ